MEPRAAREPRGILPFAAFKDLLRRTDLDRLRVDPRTAIEDERAFDEMREHLGRLYEDVEAVYSFEDAAGQIFDCIPIEQQPSLRGSSEAPPQPPDLRPVLEGRPPAVGALSPEPAAQPAGVDRHGNRMQAPPGTIPMRRVTLEELARFRNLRDFYRKYPSTNPPSGRARAATALEERDYANKGTDSDSSGTVGPIPTVPSAPNADVNQNHRYAYTEQTVNSLGAHSSLALYAPAVNDDQVFSLAQHWYSGGAGANNQTVEVGWQVYPGKYGHAQPVLFIYWTADNYVSTGAYNLDAPGFVQTNNSWTIGGAISPVSTVGGQQMEIEVTVYLLDGRWWLYLGGIAPENAIGYYPTTLYGTGQLASNATEIKFGGETVTRVVSWPPMGSGNFANGGWQQAAYQRNIYYFPTAGGSAWTTLTARQPSPACYTLDLKAAAAPWGVYFFYGGPGGGDC